MPAILKLQNEFFPTVSALTLAVAIPCLHILASRATFTHESYIVNRKNCSCSCWDTVFKGPYESGIARYKHIYFNATSNTAKIWIVLCIGIIAFFESARYIFKLLIRRNLRISIASVFSLSLNSHCYAWWVHFNYWNEDFYQLANHQVFVTVTKIICSALLFRGIDKRNVLETSTLLAIASISSFHLFCSDWDQIGHNVLLRNGKSFEALRDMALMTTDVMIVVVTVIELRSTSKEDGVWGVISKRHNFLYVFTTIMLMCLANLILI